jgi:hypothetical protein
MKETTAEHRKQESRNQMQRRVNLRAIEKTSAQRDVLYHSKPFKAEMEFGSAAYWRMRDSRCAGEVESLNPSISTCFTVLAIATLLPPQLLASIGLLYSALAQTESVTLLCSVGS